MAFRRDYDQFDNDRFYDSHERPDEVWNGRRNYRKLKRELAQAQDWDDEEDFDEEDDVLFKDEYDFEDGDDDDLD